jgi:glyoxylate carboligase
MQRTAASLARHALEQLGIRYTFGIPGVHNTELYDQMAASESITPVLVAHEGGGAFMADAVSRTGAGVGALLIVPAAGVTHAASGIGEAFLDGIRCSSLQAASGATGTRLPAARHGPARCSRSRRAAGASSAMPTLSGHA